jgi:acyl carrier protein
MNKNDFYLKLDEVLDLAPGTVKGTDALADLEGWDSVAVISFIAMADADYGVILPSGQIAGCRTADDLAELIVALQEQTLPQ